MDVDYRKYEVGMGLGPDIVLSKCPLCGKPCHHKTFSKRHEYRHAVEVYRRLPKPESTRKRVSNAARVTLACKETVNQAIAAGR